MVVIVAFFVKTEVGSCERDGRRLGGSLRRNDSYTQQEQQAASHSTHYWKQHVATSGNKRYDFRDC